MNKSNRGWRSVILLVCAVILVSCSTETPGTVIPTLRLSQTPQASQTPPGIENIIPRPVSVISTGGNFRLTAETRISVQPVTEEVKAIGQYLADHLNPATGYNLQVAAVEGSLVLTGAPAGLPSFPFSEQQQQQLR